MADEAFRHWLREAERRYLADLTRPELGRALRVLGATYVHRRETLAGGKAEFRGVVEGEQMHGEVKQGARSASWSAVRTAPLEAPR